jgi:SAM-dependent methyltransferase
VADGPAKERPSLRELFWAHRGLLSDKWEQYIPIYESEFGPHLARGAPVALLEIGVQNGGSLEIWHRLFPPRSIVVGLEVDERCRALKLGEGIELHIGDATQQDFIDEALGDTRFDIIIDDGSHHAKDVIASFEILFRRLKPGGIYIVEDLHTSYWPAYGGGFRAEGSSIEWAKALVDAVNADHIDSAAELPADELARLRAFNTEIARIAFFDSLLVVQKYPSAKHRPFARLLTGAESPVFDPLQWIEEMPAESFGTLMAGPAAAGRLEAGLKLRIEDKERMLARQEQELQNLRSSTSWRLTAPLRRAGNILKSCAAWLGKIGRRSTK